MGASPGDARAGDARFMELALELAARALATIAAFPWAKAQTRAPVRETA